MPISSYASIPDIINSVVIKQPRTLLDVGIGNGMYGAIVSNYIPSCKIYGIEAFPNYRTPLWNVYTHVNISDVFKTDINDKYDCIIIADVIEHFEKEIGLKVIEKLKEALNPAGVLLISTPSIFCEQGAVGGNEFERHKSLFTKEDFKDIPGWEILKDGEPDKWGHYMLVIKFTK